MYEEKRNAIVTSAVGQRGSRHGGVGRGAAVGRWRGIGVTRGVGVGLGVAVAVTVAVGVGEAQLNPLSVDL